MADEAIGIGLPLLFIGSMAGSAYLLTRERRDADNGNGDGDNGDNGDGGTGPSGLSIDISGSGLERTFWAIHTDGDLSQSAWSANDTDNDWQTGETGNPATVTFPESGNYTVVYQGVLEGGQQVAKSVAVTVS